MKLIPFYLHDICEEEIEEITKTLRSGWVATGPKVAQFGEGIRNLSQTERVQILTSATAALFSALCLFGIRKGDEVIVSAYTFCSSANVILQCGATPVFCDVDDSFLLDLNDLEKKITPKTKAVIPVDFAGLVCDYDGIEQIVQSKKHLFSPSGNPYQKQLGRALILGDCAHSLGSFHRGRPAGSLADLSAFSFHVVKNITTIDGGALLCPAKTPIDKEAFFQELKELSLHGMNASTSERAKGDGWSYDVRVLGYKFNMSDFQATLGISQLRRWPNFLKKRRQLAKRYDDKIGALKGISPLIYDEKIIDSCYHLYPILLDEANEDRRKRIIKKMRESFGISLNVHFKPVPLLSLYRRLGYHIEDTPKTLELYQREITLPLYTQLELEDVDYIVESFEKTVNTL